MTALLILLVGVAILGVLLGLLFKRGPVEQQVAVTRPRAGKVDHVVHFLLTVGTVGLWFAVWVICAARGPRRQ